MLLNRTDSRGTWAQEVTDAFADAGWVVLDPAPAHRDAADKHRAYHRFMAAGLPVIDTVTVSMNAETSPLSYPVVLKDRFGSSGRQVRLAGDDRSFQAALADLAGGIDDGIVVQPFVTSPTRPEDLRVHVVCDAARLVLRRRAADGQWQTNQAQESTVERYDGPLRARAEQVAVAAAASAGLVWSAVDLLVTEGGDLVVCETNTSPGVAGLVAALGPALLRGVITEVLEEGARLLNRP